MSPHEAKVLEEQRLAEERIVAEVGHPLPMGVLNAETRSRVECCAKCGLPRSWTRFYTVSCIAPGPDGYPEPQGDHEFVMFDPPAVPLLVPIGEAADDLWENDEEPATPSWEEWMDEENRKPDRVIGGERFPRND